MLSKKFSSEKGSSFQLLGVGLKQGNTRVKEWKIRTSPVLAAFLKISCSENYTMRKERVCMDFPPVWLGQGFVGCHSLAEIRNLDDLNGHSRCMFFSFLET